MNSPNQSGDLENGLSKIRALRFLYFADLHSGLRFYRNEHVMPDSHQPRVTMGERLALCDSFIRIVVLILMPTEPPRSGSQPRRHAC
jgi:hypothetical protein